MSRTRAAVSVGGFVVRDCGDGYGAATESNARQP
jgi:hypothetical protein